MAGEENTGMESYTKESGGYREIEKSDTFNQYFIAIGSHFYQSFKKHPAKKKLISSPVLREVEGLLPLQFCLKSVPVSH